MKMLITIWNNRVAPVFDAASHGILCEQDDNNSLRREEIVLPSSFSLYKASFLYKSGIDELICGAISNQVHFIMRDHGIKIYPFVAGDIETVIQAWMKDEIANLTYTMPGCCREKCCCNQEEPLPPKT